MASKYAFNPAYTQGVSVSPAAAAASSTIGKGSKALCLTNTGVNVCYVRTGPSGVAATAADYPILGGAQVIITKDEQHDTASYISPLGTTLHIIPGEGL